MKTKLFSTLINNFLYRNKEVDWKWNNLSVTIERNAILLNCSQGFTQNFDISRSLPRYWIQEIQNSWNKMWQLAPAYPTACGSDEFLCENLWGHSRTCGKSQRSQFRVAIWFKSNLQPEESSWKKTERVAFLPFSNDVVYDVYRVHSVTILIHYTKMV